MYSHVPLPLSVPGPRHTHSTKTLMGDSFLFVCLFPNDNVVFCVVIKVLLIQQYVVVFIWGEI